MKTFNEHLTDAIAASHAGKRPLGKGECQSSHGARCNLCHAIDLTYEIEVALKNKALSAFWEQQYAPDLLSTLIPSPLGRSYRTVTKRRAFHVRQSCRLGLIAPTDEGSYEPFDVVTCAIEPVRHSEIYQSVQQSLEKPYAAPLSEVLSYVIIKGSFTEQTLILNVREITPTVVRAANTLSKSLTHAFKELIGVFLYEDTSSSNYYLGRSNNRGQPTMRKIFGKAEIYHKTCGRSFLYSPFAFSQTNQSMLELLVTQAGRLLELNDGMTLLDLYCGYGLFALCLAHSARYVEGVEISAESIASAIANARRQKTTNVRFIRTNITVDSIARLMERVQKRTAIILDPPRSGVAEGVIECIAARKPGKVLHIFCNIDIMPAELQRWTGCGYRIVKAIPLDMFPGTSSIEIMVLLTPSQQGVASEPPGQ